MKVSILQESNNYVCVHAKKGKYNCRAETSYGAAKKAAEHWGLKSTSGIDAHLADKEKTATEGLEGMTPNTQVRGIMPKQRKPYHKHKIKSNHEPKVEEESIKEAYINNAKDAINILGQLRGRGKQLERGQQEYKGNLPNEYVNDVWDVWTWMESKLGGGAEANDPKLKQIMQEVFWLRGEAKKMERNYSPDLERSEDYMGAAGFGNMVVNTLYPLMQWIDMNENKLDYTNDAERKSEYGESVDTGHDFDLLKKVVAQIIDDAKAGDYTAIDDLLKHNSREELQGFLSQVESVTEGCGCGPDCSCGGNCGPDCNCSNCNESQEDNEYDPRRVKADVMKHLVNMYNDAKKDGGYTSEEMRFALGNLLHDMDMAGYMNSDYYDIEGFFHKGIDIKADEKINMGMLKKAYTQAKNLDTDTSVDPDIFTRGGSAMKSHATESKSMLGEVTKALTEEEFDEAAGEKDACYRKVKSRYKVWPSAYASGALVKCRKVGAANWGNKSK